MTAAHIGIPRPRGFAFGPGRQGHLTTTPIYDALAEEFRFALRTVPGDHGVEERLFSALFTQHYNFSAVGRSGNLELGHSGSRHRGLPENGTAQF